MKTIEEVFVSNLRRLRGQRTQAEMAEAAGIPFRTYQHAESGSIPQGPNRQAIARACGVEEIELFIDADSAGRQSHLLPPDLARDLAVLTGEKRVLALKLIRSILDGLAGRIKDG